MAWNLFNHPRKDFSVSFLVRRSLRPGHRAEVAQAKAAGNPYQAEIPSARAIGIIRYAKALSGGMTSPP